MFLDLALISECGELRPTGVVGIQAVTMTRLCWGRELPCDYQRRTDMRKKKNEANVKIDNTI